MKNMMSAIGNSFQGTALFMIVWGTVVTCIGCRNKWEAVSTLGVAITGAGVQAITTAVRNTLKAEDGSTVNLGATQQ